MDGSLSFWNFDANPDKLKNDFEKVLRHYNLPNNYCETKKSILKFKKNNLNVHFKIFSQNGLKIPFSKRWTDVGLFGQCKRQMNINSAIKVSNVIVTSALQPIV